LAVVYWLFDANCTDPWSQGYVGVTINLPNRLKQHRAKRGVFEHLILFESTETECYALEAAMRPNAFIGWNEAWGGECGGGKHPRSAETRERMRQASLRRYTDPHEREKMRELMKGRKITWGVKISAGKRGAKLSDATRAKMSAVRKGRSRRPFTPEHCANISAARKGMPWVTESNRRRAVMLTEVSLCP
jgi:hypothetical protein